MKWREKMKFKISQATYKSKIFDHMPNQVSNIMEDVENFLEESWEEQKEKIEKKSGKGKSRKKRRFY